MNSIADRRLEEKERRRSEILDAAEAAAATSNLDDLTMDEVARNARLSRALIYVYFSDKSELLFGLAERAFGKLHQRFAESATRHKRGLEQVQGMGRAYVAFSQEFPVLFDALARFEMHAPEVDSDSPHESGCVLQGDKLHVLLMQSIELGMRDGSIRADVGPPALVSVTLWGFMHGVIQLAKNKANVLAHDGIDSRALFDHALVMATRGLAKS
jgi:TetR/AcrR family transcriptional regulator